MSLSERQIQTLGKAIDNYQFPTSIFDFQAQQERKLPSVSDVETRIAADLKSGVPRKVYEGLSNILYWGYSQQSGRRGRPQKFSDKVGPESPEIQAATRLFEKASRPTLQEIARLKLPEFSNISFLSKIRAFLDPTGSAVLDLQLMKIRTKRPDSILSCVRWNGETHIRATQHNSLAYEAWCGHMFYICSKYFDAKKRPVDVERGLFQLVQTDHVASACAIVCDA